MQSYINYFKSLTMYQTMLCYLISIYIIALVFSATNILSFNFINLAFSGVYLIATCVAFNYIFAYFFKTTPHTKSAIITALILTLITSPSPFEQISFLTALALISQGSKYLFTIDKRHIFNPAAIAVIATSILMGQGASWWVGTPALFPFVLILGIIVAWKIHRRHLAGSFIGTFFIILAATLLLDSNPLPVDIVNFINANIYSPIFFFGLVMVTEPMTCPPTKKSQVVYGGGIALLYFALQWITPATSYGLELSLVMANLVARLTFRTPRVEMTLLKRVKKSPSIYSFVFEPLRPFKYQAGQFMEWSLAHKSPDSRGVRRFFTLSSSPSEKQIAITTRVTDKSSTFKKALLDLKPGDKISASGLEGDFVLPKNNQTKCIFIAGGIGVTPYHSMVKYLLDTNEKRPITLFYMNREKQDFVFKDLFDEAKEIGFKTIYTLTEKPSHSWTGEQGVVDRDMLEKYLPDFMDHIIYVSGPEPMVEDYEKKLKSWGVKKSQIKTDFFPGYENI